MARDWFHPIAERLTDPLLAVSPDGNIELMNRAAAVQFEWMQPGVNLIEQSIDGSALARFLRLAFRTATPLPGVTRFGDDSTRWRCDGSVVIDGQGPLVILHLRAAAESTRRFVVLNEQIRQLQSEVRRRKALEEERTSLLEAEREARSDAESASRLKDELLASVSHELRTPLNAIAGWVAILRSNTEPEMLARGLEVIERNVDVEAQLTEDLVDASLIFTGRMKLELEPVDLEPLARQAVENISPLVESKDLRVELIAETGTCVVNGDPDRLLQIIGNLLNNSVKYTPKGGRIQISLKRVNSHAELQVSDSGEGIPSDLLPYVFDRFRRADGSHTRRHGGLGLGLAIVHHLVELHGGVIVAHSDGPGTGSTFSVNLPLPLFRRRAPVVTTPSAPSEAESLEGLHILLVEDHDDSREILSNILEARGAALTAVDGSAAAQAAFRKSAPDILISDIEMPEEDGFTLMRKLREIEEEIERSPIPAIAVSAHAIGNARVHALNAGFQSFLAKPVHSAELVALINSLLAQQRRRDGRTTK